MGLVSAITTKQIKYIVEAGEKSKRIAVIGDNAVNVALSFIRTGKTSKQLTVLPAHGKDEMICRAVEQKKSIPDTAREIYQHTLDEIDLNNPFELQLLERYKRNQVNYIKKLEDELGKAFRGLPNMTVLEYEEQREFLKTLTEQDFAYISNPIYEYDISEETSAKVVITANSIYQDEALRKMKLSCVYAEDMIKKAVKLYSNEKPKPAAVPLIIEKKIEYFPVYANNKIHKATKITVKKFNDDTALYYRDLFQHNFGGTQAILLCAGLFLDGRLVQVLGFDYDKIGYEEGVVFLKVGVQITSRRYKKLSRLLTMCLLSGEMKAFLELHIRRGFSLIKSIRTSDFSRLQISKASEGMMELISKEQMPNGKFRLVYQQDFNEMSFKDCLVKWRSNHFWSEETDGYQVIGAGERNRNMEGANSRA